MFELYSSQQYYIAPQMIKFLFLSIPSDSTYESLKWPLKYHEDEYGVSNWAMKHPLTIYTADLKQKHVFKQGEVILQYVANPSLQQKWKYFVITRGDGHKYYCTSQIFYQKALLKPQTVNLFSSMHSYLSTEISTQSKPIQFYLPKCLVMISQLPYFKLQVNLLKIHKQLRKKQPAISYCIEDDLFQIYLQLLQTGRQKQWEYINLSKYKSYRRSYCPIELCLGYYTDCCNTHLSGQTLYIQKSSNRQVLHLYKLLASSLYQISYFFHLPFCPKTLRIVISAILTQKQIIFASSNQNLIVMVIQTLMQMVAPLRWCYLYAPNLPIQMIQAAQQSFMPYIVGINKQNLSLINISNKVIVKIDTDEVIYGEDLYLISSKYQKYLTFKTNSNKQYLDWQKQIRINSIMLITALLRDNINNRQFIDQQQKASEKAFYQQFLSKSMMYQKLKEDTHENIYNQFYKLIKMPLEQRKVFLTNKFTALHSQTIYPSRFDNQKKWLKYYQEYTRNRRKSRLSRGSLNLMDQTLIKSTLGSTNHYAIRDFRGSLVNNNNNNNNMTASLISNTLSNTHYTGNLSSRNLSVTQSTVIL